MIKWLFVVAVRRILRRFFFVFFLLLATLVAFAQWQIAVSQIIAPGVVFQELRRSDPPTWIGVVRINRPLPPDLVLQPLLGREPRLGRSPLSQIVASTEPLIGYVTAAINGDYFSLGSSPQEGGPLGLSIANGQLIRMPFPSRSVLVAMKDGSLYIASFRGEGKIVWSGGKEDRVDGLNQPLTANGWMAYSSAFGASTRTPPGTVEVLLTGTDAIRPQSPWVGTVSEIRTEGDSPISEKGLVLSRRSASSAPAFVPEVGSRVSVVFRITSDDERCRPEDIVWAIGGGPRLIRRGVAYVAWEEEGFSRAFSETPHPRTAVGFKKDSLFFIVVDGRQPGYSQGMRLTELANFLKGLGCDEAMNLDGGGSSTLYVRGQIANRPSDGRERPIANALALFNLFPPQPVIRILAQAAADHWLAGSSIPIRLSAEDAAYRVIPAPMDAVKVRWEPSDLPLIWSDGRLQVPDTLPLSRQDVKVTFSIADPSASPATLLLTLHQFPEALAIIPNPIIASPAGSVTLSIRAWVRGSKGERVPVAVDHSAVQWRVDPLIGRMEGNRLIFASPPSSGRLVATYRGVVATASVLLSQPSWLLLHDLEDLSHIQLEKTPQTVDWSAEIVSSPKVSGQGALRIFYDFSKASGTRAGYVVINQDLPKGALQLSLMVLGDGQGCWLRARLRSADGLPILMDLAPSIDWSGEWKEVIADLPVTGDTLRFEAIYLVCFRPEHKPKGTVVLDALRCYSPAP